MRIAERIGPALERLRRERGLTQSEVERRAEMTPRSLTKYERPRRSYSWSSIEKILDALDADLLDLYQTLTGEPPSPSPPPPPVNAEGADEPIDRFAVRLAVEALRDRGAVKELKEIAMSGKLPDLQRAGETSGRVDKGTAPVRGKAARGNGS
jgi:transcriptional regulator with XRE-family HTH domain